MKSIQTNETKVKEAQRRESRGAQYPHVLTFAPQSTRKVFFVIVSLVRRSGSQEVELDPQQLASLTGLARSTVYKAICWLSRTNLLVRIAPRRGRGKHSLYRLTWRVINASTKSTNEKAKRSCSELTNNSTIKNVHSYNKVLESINIKKQSKDKKIKKIKTTIFDYQGEAGLGVMLRIGWRFYRQVMKTVRLGWEAWGLPQDICDTVEGLYGSWIDGASLDYARKLYDRICLLRPVICKWADQGLSSRQVYKLLAARLKERDSFWEVLEFGRRDPNLLGQAALAVLLEKEVPMKEPRQREVQCRECGAPFHPHPAGCRCYYCQAGEHELCQACAEHYRNLAREAIKDFLERNAWP